MQYRVYADLSNTERKALCRRPATTEQEQIATRVAEIEEQIQQQGAVALERFSRDFDGVALKEFEVARENWGEAWQMLKPELQEALNTALENIAKFHQLPKRREPPVETSPGVHCWREFRAIDSVGLYIPGGSAPLFSSMLMLGVPAIIAGCPEIIFCSPPLRDARGFAPSRGVHAATEMLACMHLLSEFATPQNQLHYFQVGGAQAIFAMAQEGVLKENLSAHKVFGPGNSYVTEAKLRVSRRIAIDIPAGPSEVLAIAERGQNPAIIAADLLAQAEHGPSSQVLLLSPDAELLRSTEREVARQKAELPRELETALSNSYLLETADLEQAVNFSNSYAPEHLILALANPEPLLPQIRNAGSVFCGANASESFGDYASGTNHTLPTAGFARSHSGVHTESFGRWLTFQSVSEQGLQALGPKVEVLAEAEQLAAHKNAVTQRLKQTLT